MQHPKPTLTDSIQIKDHLKPHKLPSQSSFVQVPSKFITHGVYSKHLSEDPSLTISNFNPVIQSTGHPVIIGSGTFSVVYLYKHKITEKEYAIKHMLKSKIKESCGNLDAVYKEVKIQSKIKHNNITQLYSINETEDDFKLVLEYSKHGNLFKIINKTGITEDEAFHFFIQTVNAVYFLHENNLIHRDIKPENLLLNKDENYNIKLCDFGWCSEVEIGNRKTFCGTFEYMAPEIIREEPYDKSIDIWALGVLLYEMIYGYSPFRAEHWSQDKTKDTLMNILQRKLKFDNPNIEISRECKELIEAMIEPDINKRISIKDILLSDFVKKYEYKIYGKIDEVDFDSAPNPSEDSYKYNNTNVKGIEKKKEDEKFFHNVLKQVKPKGKKVKKEIKYKVNDAKREEKVNKKKKHVVEKEGPLQDEVYKSQQNKEDFLKRLNRDEDGNEEELNYRPSKLSNKKLHKHKVNSQSNKITAQSLSDAIKIIDVLPQNEQCIQPRSNLNKPEVKEETFWQKLFKNFKCD